LKIATWNVNGIRARETQLVEWLASEIPDVLCLQEVKASPAQVPAPLAAMENYWSLWHCNGAYSGIGLHVRKGLAPEKPKFIIPEFDFETRIATAQIGQLVVASVYVPNGGKDFDAKMRFLEAMEHYVEESHAAGLRLILCGDMNVTRSDMDVHPKERNPNTIGQLPEERHLIERILAHDLADLSRALHPDDESIYTWWAPWRKLRQRNIGWRIDYILATRSLVPRVLECSVSAAVGTSDHAPVVARLDYDPGA